MTNFVTDDDYKELEKEIKHLNKLLEEANSKFNLLCKKYTFLEHENQCLMDTIETLMDRINNH